MEKVVLLGATGSVGTSALSVLSEYKDRFTLFGVSGFRNLERLAEIIREFRPKVVCIECKTPGFESMFPECEFVYGESGLSEIACHPDAATTVVAVSGIAGLAPTLAALKSKKKFLTANKESLVCAGEKVMQTACENGVQIVPLDSEHNAVFQAITRFPVQSIANIVLTASGGPFRTREIDESVTLEQVLDHPTWNMGKVITVNSATMMNKGFEVIEAHYLFGMDYDRIQVLIHPQSFVHGMAELTDGSRMMLASPNDMRYPIALALFYPDVPVHGFPKLTLDGVRLEFDLPDVDRFPLLKLAYDCGRSGGLYPAALNACNEEAVNAFLTGKIRFIDIPDIVHRAVDTVRNISHPDLDAILECDRQIRLSTARLL